MTVAYYIEKLNNAYMSARENYKKKFEVYDEANSELAKLQKRRNEYSLEGYDEREQAIRSKIRAAQEDIYSVSHDFESEAAEIRRGLVLSFSDKYSANPDNIDSNGITLLQSGLLTDNELLAMAEKYNSNATMKRFIGAEIEKRGFETGNSKLRSQGTLLREESTKQPHTELFDSFAELCKKGLRTGEDTGDLRGARILSDGFNDELYNTTYNNHYTAGEGINNEV